MVSRRTAVLGGLLLVLLTFLATWGLASGVYAGPFGGRAALRGLERTPGFANLVRGLALLQEQYLVPPDMAAVSQAALRAAVASLGDPYSAYLNPQDYRAVRGSASGRYSGIGVEVEAGGSAGPMVTRVFPGSPAATTPYAGEAPGHQPGLLPGDRLVAVDGTPVAGMDPAAVRGRIVGPSGTTVRLEVARPVVAGSAPPAPAPAAGAPPPAAGPGILLTFTFTRRAVEVQSVAWKALGGGIGYLDIEMFNSRTPAEVGAALTSLRAAGVRRLVLDLRDNPGGLLSSAVDVSRYFLPGGVVASLQPRSGPATVYRVASPMPLQMPLLVLVNHGTASAAEILAGAIQDDGAAPLLGSRTFGKGVVQRIFPLAGGAALKLTVGRYLTPRGRDLGGQGLTPDVSVSFPGATPATMGDPATDPQLAAAVRMLQRSAAA